MAPDNDKESSSNSTGAGSSRDMSQDGPSQASAVASTSSGITASQTVKSMSVLTEEQLMAALIAAEDDEDTALTIGQLLQQQEEGFMVEPLLWCPHLDTSVSSLPERGLRVSDRCFACGSTDENWVCLMCYKVGCGRFVSKHMLQHGEAENHPLVLSYSDLSVWCYSCQQYVHNKILKEAKESAHENKFGKSMDLPESWKD